MSTDLVRHSASQLALSADDVSIIKATVAQGTSDTELALFLATAARLGLDPFARQIYAVVRRTKDGPRMAIQIGIDGWRLIAERTGEYQGQVGPWWVRPHPADPTLRGSPDDWIDYWYFGNMAQPAAAKVGVWRRGFREPVFAVAHWREFAQYDSEGHPQGQWGSMPAHMLAKCAERLALARAFPADVLDAARRLPADVVITGTDDDVAVQQQLVAEHEQPHEFLKERATPDQIRALRRLTADREPEEILERTGERTFEELSRDEAAALLREWQQ